MIGYEINYRIDNFSGIIPINKETLKDFKDSIRGVYMLYDKDKQLIYVGMSKMCIRGRIHSHKYGGDRERLMEAKIFEKYKSEKYEYFSYMKIEKEFIAIVEAALIRDLKPRFNKTHNSEYEDSSEWLLYLLNHKDYQKHLKNKRR